jgi:hypothetical protein
MENYWNASFAKKKRPYKCRVSIGSKAYASFSKEKQHAL